MEKEKLLCCICGKEIKKEGCPSYFGNNPDGAMWKDKDGKLVEGKFQLEDRCCDECDNKYVIPGRIYKLMCNKKE